MVVVVERGQRDGVGGGPVPHSPVKTVQPTAQPHRLLQRKYFTDKISWSFLGLLMTFYVLVTLEKLTSVQ